jgi:hypothetical protein
MPEMLLHHQLERLGGAGRISSDHRVLGHDLADHGRSRIKSFGRDLSKGLVTIHKIQLYDSP